MSDHQRARPGGPGQGAWRAGALEHDSWDLRPRPLQGSLHARPLLLPHDRSPLAALIAGLALSRWACLTGPGEPGSAGLVWEMPRLGPAPALPPSGPVHAPRAQGPLLLCGRSWLPRGTFHPHLRLGAAGTGQGHISGLLIYSAPQQPSREPDQAELQSGREHCSVAGMVGHVPSGVLWDHLPQASAGFKGQWAPGLSRLVGVRVRVRLLPSVP